jgi:hypothetical protein
MRDLRRHHRLFLREDAMRSESLAHLLDRADTLYSEMREPLNRLTQVNARIARNQASNEDFAEHGRLTEQIGTLMGRLAEVRLDISEHLALHRARAA